MSLDFNLYFDAEEDERCPTCGQLLPDNGVSIAYSGNITHNLARMAEEAGVYKLLWRPEEKGVWQARQLIGPLAKTIAKMKADPEKFKKRNPPSDWGNYDVLLSFMEEVLKAAKQYPDAKIGVSR
jgi:hypothetical protein